MKLSKIACIAMLLFIPAGLFSQAQILEILEANGNKVEVKKAGSTVWERAVKGQVLSRDSMISTGFNCAAVVMLGNSRLTVRPLTRLSFAELSRIQDNEKTELNLQTGRVRAEVRPPQGGRTDFTVRSSAATAAVRGTVFEFDTLNLKVSQGTVEFSGAAGTPSVLVDSGGISYADEHSGRAAPQEETAIAELRPELPSAAAEALPAEEASPEKSNTIELSVTLDF